MTFCNQYRALATIIGGICAILVITHILYFRPEAATRASFMSPWHQVQVPQTRAEAVVIGPAQTMDENRDDTDTHSEPPPQRLMKRGGQQRKTDPNNNRPKGHPVPWAQGPWTGEKYALNYAGGRVPPGGDMRLDRGRRGCVTEAVRKNWKYVRHTDTAKRRDYYNLDEDNEKKPQEWNGRIRNYPQELTDTDQRRYKHYDSIRQFGAEGLGYPPSAAELKIWEKSGQHYDQGFWKEVNTKDNPKKRAYYGDGINCGYEDVDIVL